MVINFVGLHFIRKICPLIKKYVQNLFHKFKVITFTFNQTTNLDRTDYIDFIKPKYFSPHISNIKL